MKAVVIGSMNCMPTEYAIVLKKYFKTVVHYYDAPATNTLSNPTVRWGERSSARTAGVVLRSLYFSKYPFFLLPQLFHRKILKEIDDADLIILSGASISFARFIKTSGKKVIALSYGSDISLFCNPIWPAMRVPNASIMKVLIGKCLKPLKTKFSKYQIEGLRKSTHYSYFIPGLDPETDLLLGRLLTGQSTSIRLPRYSIELNSLENTNANPQLTNLKNQYKIVFPVRFSDDELIGNKGWRLLFNALNIYRLKTDQKFICVCFKKGNYPLALKYAQDLGIADCIEWHDVVPFSILTQYYMAADVVVEQLGTHWIGQGLYAMLLGKPVIGKVSTIAQMQFFKGSGLLEVSDLDSLVNHLINCESKDFRNTTGNISRQFVPLHAAIEPEFLKWNVF